MEKNNDLGKSLSVAKDIAENTSWFRGDLHRWALTSLPLAYAMACVEVVSKSSEKTGESYRQIIEARGKPGFKAMSGEVFSAIPDSEMERVTKAL